MRSPLPALVRTALVGTLATLLLAGCSKKTVAPNSLPQPEGQQDQMLMVGWPETPSVWFTIGDPGTPDTPSDDFLQFLGLDYHADPNGVRCAALDLSPANQLEAFRVDAEGNARPLFDYLLSPELRLLDLGLDLYQFEDLSPPANPAYYGRGALDGVRTPSSPVTNRVEAAGAVRADLDFLPDLIYRSLPGVPKDSVLKLRWTEDPEALFYIVEVDDANPVLGAGSSFSLERRTRAIPSPMLPGTRPLQRKYLYVALAGEGITGQNFLIDGHGVWPRFYSIRVTAYNAQGRMINRVNDYLRTQVRDGNLNLTTLEPLGGAIEILDPYPVLTGAGVDVPIILTNQQAFNLLQGFGVTAPAQTSLLSGTPSALSSMVPSSPGMPERFQPFDGEASFSREAVRAKLAAIRARMDGGTATMTPQRSAAVRR